MMPITVRAEGINNNLVHLPVILVDQHEPNVAAVEFFRNRDPVDSKSVRMSVNIPRWVLSVLGTPKFFIQSMESLGENKFTIKDCRA